MTYEEAKNRIYLHGKTMTEDEALVILDALEKQIPKDVQNTDIENADNILDEVKKYLDKYRRHDLKKNPEDLPEGHTNCLIWIKTVNNIMARVAFYNGKEFILHRNQNQSQVLAWKYIEPFEEVE